ncbi:MAG: hypothetical protein RR280_08695 [Bacteroidaceae bacterium]
MLFAEFENIRTTEYATKETAEEAEKYGVDYYLVDGRGKPIYMMFTKAYDFFTREN